MNFFEYQERARRNSGLLVLLFSAAVLALIAATTLFTAALLAWSRGESFAITQIHLLLGWQTIGGIALTIAAIIALGSLYKLKTLSAGGRAVAESLGGRKINGSPRDLAEQRALNVVEEMAIASGTPVPDVYVLDDDAINAFAAGYKSSDAVIGLTRGCIERLNREELAGVVAHEFSHIFNGDMRLNIRIVGLLHGILIIGLLGYWLLRGSAYRSGRDSRGRGAMLGVGIGLLVIGYTGTFFGNLIKSAVSRQREYLADASAVQFTRDNRGIAGALKKIGGYSGGSHLKAAAASEFSHMYFADGMKKSFANLFATHPPLTGRIARLDPQWNGRFAPLEEGSAQSAAPAAQSAQVMGMAAQTPVASVMQAVDNSIGNPGDAQVRYARQLLHSAPQSLQQAARDPFAARALVYRLLFHPERDQQQRQRELLQQIAHPAVVREMARLEAEIEKLPATARLPLLDLCVPALKSLVPQQYQVFKRNLIKLIHSDGRMDLWEWALYRVLMHALEGAPDHHRTLTSSAAAPRDAARFLIAAVAHAGNPEYLPALRAYEAGLRELQLEAAPLPAAGDMTLPRLDKAIAVASRIKPLQKPRLLKAMAAAMAHNQVITAEELELLRAVADSLDCPMPPLVDGIPAPTALRAGVLEKN